MTSGGWIWRKETRRWNFSLEGHDWLRLITWPSVDVVCVRRFCTDSLHRLSSCLLTTHFMLVLLNWTGSTDYFTAGGFFACQPVCKTLWRNLNTRCLFFYMQNWSNRPLCRTVYFSKCASNDQIFCNNKHFSFYLISDIYCRFKIIMNNEVLNKWLIE